MPEARQSRWHRLDNTANLFPVITSRRYANVYRLSITLHEAVNPELLQKALNNVIEWFPTFQVRLRRGLFWHYLETNTAQPQIAEEDDFPCGYIDPQHNRQFLFRVTYYDARINLEVYHVLTDGTGGLRFLQAIVCQYLMLAYPASFTNEQKQTRWFVQHANNTEDSYATNYTPTKKSNFRMGRGYKLKGERNSFDALGVIHAHIELSGLKQVCKAKGVTVGQYLTACIAWGIYTQQLKGHPARYPVNIFLPVNLRPIFNSNTSLNFFSNIYISLPFNSESITFEDVLQETRAQFEEKVNRQAMLEKISYTVGSGYSKPIRVVPLPIKNIALRLIFETSASSSSLSFTNVGIVKMPPEFAPYVTGVYTLLSPAPREPFKVAALSYGSTLTLSFTSTLRSTDLQRDILRTMTKDGLQITIETNGVDYESM